MRWVHAGCEVVYLFIHLFTFLAIFMCYMINSSSGIKMKLGLSMTLLPIWLTVPEKRNMRSSVLMSLTLFNVVFKSIHMGPV